MDQVTGGTGESTSDPSAVGGMRGALNKFLAKNDGNVPVRGTDAYSDEKKILDTFKDFKKLCFEDRSVYERQWQRAIHYDRNRHWIWYNRRSGEWQDKKLARWIPKPVINKCGESRQALEAMFASTKLGLKARPRGEGPANAAAASVADQLEPFIAEEHDMETAQAQFDHWFVLLGSGFLHPYWDRDPNGHMTDIPAVTCPQCQIQASWDLDPEEPCPTCGGPLQPAMGPAGAMITRPEIVGRGKTIALSPLEVAFPLSTQVWEDVPGVIRLRWRDESYYKNYKGLDKKFLDSLRMSTAVQERSLQIFRSLPLLNDTGSTTSSDYGAGQVPNAKGVGEYEAWIKPTEDFPDGLVVRVTDTDVIVPLTESEGMPGKFPYQDIKGNRLFPWIQASYKAMGGRVLGSGALDSVISIQDQINQLMSLIQMIVQRTANPIWLEEKGSEVEKFTGEPGIVVKWNSMGGIRNPPSRIPGENIPETLFKLLEELYKTFEEQIGTFDIMKGQKPAGVAAFSALQLLVERSQSRFSSAFKARAKAYKEWYAIAIEMERQFGPNTRNESVLGPNNSYYFKHFKKADLGAGVTFVLEDGVSTPKTSLATRAALEQGRQLGVVDVKDPDQRYFALKVLGIPELDPALDVQVSAAHRKQEAFETFLTEKQFANAMAVSPLIMDEWHDPIIHRRECLKWANSDRMVDLFAQYGDSAKKLVSGYLQLIGLAMGVMPGTPLVGPDGQPIQQPGPAGPGAAPNPNGGAMATSTKNSTSTKIVPHGNEEGSQNQGPT